MIEHLIELARTFLGSALGTSFALWLLRHGPKEEEMIMVMMSEALKNEKKIARIEKHLNLEPLYPPFFDKIEGPR